MVRHQSPTSSWAEGVDLECRLPCLSVAQLSWSVPVIIAGTLFFCRFLVAHVYNRTMNTMTTVPSITTVSDAVWNRDLEPMAQVVLYNDDVNNVGHVVSSLARVFGHSGQLSLKLAMEAHENGRVVVEVEALSQATLHKEQLQSYSLTVDVERI